MPSSTSDALVIDRSLLDEERFGIRAARSTLTSVDQIGDVLAFCQSNEIAFLTVRCPAQSWDIVHGLEHAQFSLMDTLIYYRFNFEKTPVVEEPDVIPIRLIHANDTTEVEQVHRVAQESFHHYTGHYHADPRLPVDKSDEVYISWAVRSCTVPGVADAVMVAERDGKIVGFSTMRRMSPDEVEWQLVGISVEARGLGLYRSFAIRALEWSKSQNVKHMIASTQITNVTPQKHWSQLGFLPFQSLYTYHKWFD